MPNWADILNETQQLMLLRQSEAANAPNIIRHKYFSLLHSHTGRNVIAYYSGFLSKPNVYGIEINDEDKNGFMTAIHRMDRSKGLDLILHTPGGGLSSTQSIINYLHKMFRPGEDAVPDIRAIIPQIAMSAGTIIACSCKEILMGKQSNIGPIDPQLNGIPAYGVLKEFERAFREVKADPAKIPIWQSIISQYRPTFLSRCENAISGSNKFVTEQLASVMFNGTANARRKAASVVRELTHYTKNKGHDRHIHFEECVKIGLKVTPIEQDTKLQDLVLTVHHCYINALMNSQSYKIIENHLGVGIFKNLTQPQK